VEVCGIGEVGECQWCDGVGGVGIGVEVDGAVVELGFGGVRGCESSLKTVRFL
jgi:hypothetical protein